MSCRAVPWCVWLPPTPRRSGRIASGSG
jgi:hypothetical protein